MADTYNPSEEFEKYKSTMETRMAQLRFELERFQSSRSAMISKISNSIRIPLNGIIGMIEFLNQSDLSSEQLEYLHIIHQYSTDVLSMLTDIVDFAKVEAGEIQITKQEVKVQQLIAQTIQLHRLKAQGKNLAFSFEVNPSVPDVIVSDKDRLLQIIDNLISNSLTLTKIGRIGATISYEKRDDVNGKLIVTIEDTSEGFSESEQLIILNAIKTGDFILPLKMDQWGLGMALACSVVKALAGEFFFKSQRNIGTLYSISIPVQIPKETHKQPLKLSSISATFDRPLNILLVEDNLLNQKFAMATLSRENHHVDLAENGSKAVELFKLNHYDLILMDIQMPVMDGIQATLTIRQMEKELGISNPIRIIAVTAFALEKDREKCLAAGMDDFLAKPFKPQELIALITDNI